MSDDPFIRENATPTLHETTDNGIGADNLVVIKLVPSMGVRSGHLIKTGLP